jgi:hypothetical protein
MVFNFNMVGLNEISFNLFKIMSSVYKHLKDALNLV